MIDIQLGASGVDDMCERRPGSRVSDAGTHCGIYADFLVLAADQLGADPVAVCGSHLASLARQILPD